MVAKEYVWGYVRGRARGSCGGCGWCGKMGRGWRTEKLLRTKTRNKTRHKTEAAFPGSAEALQDLAELLKIFGNAKRVPGIVTEL